MAKEKEREIENQPRSCRGSISLPPCSLTDALNEVVFV